MRRLRSRLPYGARKPSFIAEPGVTFATWNPSDKAAGLVLSNGNLTAAADNAESVRATIGKSAGKWYWEYTFSVPTNGPLLGVANATASMDQAIGFNTDSWAYYSDGTKITDSTPEAYGASFGVSPFSGVTIGVAFDADAGTVINYKAGVSQGTMFTLSAGSYFPAVSEGGGLASTITVNFGASAFNFGVPSGYNAGLWLTAPQNTVLPAINDTTPVFAQTLTVTTGTWANAPAPTFTYQWQLGTTNISGETASSYVVRGTDVGSTIRCVVTATNAAGATVATSASTSAVGVTAYATWNSADKGAACTLSNGDLTASAPAASVTGGVRSTLSKSAGKWFWEYTIVAATDGPVVGISTSTGGVWFPGITATGWGYAPDGNKWNNLTGTAYGATFTTGDVIGVALDLGAGTLVFYKNGVSQGTAFSSLAATMFAMGGHSSGAGTQTWTANFGATAFAFAVPTGFNSGLFS